MRKHGLDVLLVLLEEVDKDIIDFSLAKLLFLLLEVKFHELFVLSEIAIAGS